MSRLVGLGIEDRMQLQDVMAVLRAAERGLGDVAGNHLFRPEIMAALMEAHRAVDTAKTKVAALHW